MSKTKLDLILGASLLLLVLFVIFVAFYIVGTPNRQRQINKDCVKLNIIENIFSSLKDLRVKNKIFPDNLPENILKEIATDDDYSAYKYSNKYRVSVNKKFTSDRKSEDVRAVVLRLKKDFIYKKINNNKISICTQISLDAKDNIDYGDNNSACDISIYNQ